MTGQRYSCYSRRQPKLCGRVTFRSSRLSAPPSPPRRATGERRGLIFCRPAAMLGAKGGTGTRIVGTSGGRAGCPSVPARIGQFCPGGALAEYGPATGKRKRFGRCSATFVSRSYIETCSQVERGGTCRRRSRGTRRMRAVAAISNPASAQARWVETPRRARWNPRAATRSSSCRERRFGSR